MPSGRAARIDSVSPGTDSRNRVSWIARQFTTRHSGHGGDESLVSYLRRFGVPALQGLDGVALSVPCVVNRTGAHPIAETPFSEHERELLHRSAASLSEVAAGLRA